MGFAEVVGHERVKAQLQTALREGRMPPALLLTGPAGIGKRRLALVTGRALLCEGPPGDACEECGACRRAQRGLHPDLSMLVPDGAFIKVDALRGLVREAAGRPFEGRARAFVIDQADCMNEQAQNALLKSLEEPPPTTHLLLVTDAAQALLPTIRSRCQELRLGALPARLLEEQLRQRGLSDEDAHLRAVLCGGSLGAALAFQSDAYQELREELLAVLEGARGWGPLERSEAAERLANTDDLALALTVLRSLLRDVAAARTGAPADRLLNADLAPRLEALGRGPLGPAATTLAEEVGTLREDLRTNANRLLLSDVLLSLVAGAAA